MLNSSDFAPTTVQTLEDILNLSRKAQKLKAAFLEFKKLYEELDNFISNDTKYRLANACESMRCYYEYIKNFLKNTEDYLSLYVEIEKLKKLDTLHDFSKVIEIASNLFCPDSLIPEFKLVDTIEQKELTWIYKSFIGSHVKLTQWIIFIQSDISNLNEFNWSSKVFEDDFRTLTKTERIHDVKYALISFCEDTTKLNSNEQNVISTSLINVSDYKSFQDKSYGFLYRFNKEDLLAMSFENANESYIFANTLPKIYQLLIEGCPLVSTIEGIKASPISLKPLYNLDDVLAKTEKSNEILLRENSKPFGIFVLEDKLENCIRQVYSLSIVYKLPLFILKNDGSLLAIPWQNVFEIE